MINQLVDGRRQFVTFLGAVAAAAFAWPLSTSAQQSDRIKLVAILMSSTENDPEGRARIAAFRRGLKELGWIEGRNLRIETRWAGADIDRIRAFTAELIALAPDVIVGNSSPVLATLHQATRAIPIVFVLVNNPIGLGIVESLARPGGNVTGFSFMETSLIGKWLDLLKQVPGVNLALLLFNPDMTPNFSEDMRSLETRPDHAVKLVGAPVHESDELEPLVSGLAREQGGSLIVPADSFNLAHLDMIARLAAQFKVPALSIYRQFVINGGLMSYGPDGRDIFRRSASYVDRVLKGANPADLPVQAPVVFNLVINLKAASSLGLDIPTNLLALADEVIE